MSSEPKQFSAGNQVVTVEDAKRGGLRWAVGTSNGPRSSTWRCWGNHLASHRSQPLDERRCETRRSAGWTSSSRRATAPRGIRRPPCFSRHMDRRTLPLDVRTCAIQILAPASELRMFRPASEAQMRWVAPPRPGNMTVVSLIVGPQVEPTEHWPGAASGSTPVGFMLTRSRSAWIIAIEEPIAPDLAEKIERHRDLILGRHPLSSNPGIRAVIAADRTDGRRMFIELAWSGSNAGVAA